MSYDVAIVGGRLAGSALAILLARAGLRVCVLDKARFPSDTASTHIVQPRGAAVLDRLGVTAELGARGAAPIERVTLVYDGARLEAAYDSPAARALLSTGGRAGLNARRTVLDDVLLRAAADAGADVRTRTAVTALAYDDDGRVTGVRTAQDTIGARVVVGADGRGSDVARWVGAREYATYPPGRLAAWGYFAGARDDAHRLRIGRVGEHAFVATPAGEGLFLAGVVPSSATRAAFLADRERAYERGLRAWPELHALVAGARRVGPLRVVPDWYGYFRTASGPGWVLAGDAGHFKDPAAAQGITDALRHAEQLATVLGESLDAGGRPDRALRAWGRRRDREAWPMHWFAADMGAPGDVRPVTAEVVRALGRDEQGAARLLQVLNRDVTPAAVLSPGRLARATGTALRRRPQHVRAVATEIGPALRDDVVRRVRRPR